MFNVYDWNMNNFENIFDRKILTWLTFSAVLNHFDTLFITMYLVANAPYNDNKTKRMVMKILV